MANALEWYAEQAEALQRYSTAEPPMHEAMLAVVAALALDGGRRAKEDEPHRYRVGDRTMRAVFEPNGITNLSNLQAVLDAVEKALDQSPVQHLRGQFLPTEDGEFNGNEWEGALSPEEQAMIDAAWEKHKSAGPVSKVLGIKFPLPSWQEQAAFEEWASAHRYEMDQHPLHYLFSDKQTNAARQGWKAALDFVRQLQDEAQPPVSNMDGNRPLPYDRETLGRFVREAWVRWAQTQPNPKPSWLVPYDELSESDKEADRQIGEAVARWTLIGDAAVASFTPPPQSRAVGSEETDQKEPNDGRLVSEQS